MYGLTTAKNKGVQFKVAAASEYVLDTFKKIKMDTILEIYNSLEEAKKF